MMKYQQKLIISKSVAQIALSTSIWISKKYYVKSKLVSQPQNQLMFNNKNKNKSSLWTCHTDTRAGKEKREIVQTGKANEQTGPDGDSTVMKHTRHNWEACFSGTLTPG